MKLLSTKLFFVTAFGLALSAGAQAACPDMRGVFDCPGGYISGGDRDILEVRQIALPGGKQEIRFIRHGHLMNVLVAGSVAEVLDYRSYTVNEKDAYSRSTCINGVMLNVDLEDTNVRAFGNDRNGNPIVLPEAAVASPRVHGLTASQLQSYAARAAVALRQQGDSSSCRRIR